MLHPSLSNAHWGTPLTKSTRYISVVERLTLPVQTSTTAVTVLQFGRYFEVGSTATSNAATISPCFGKMGTGANAPGVTETSINSALLSSGNYARANIARIGVSVLATGTSQTSGIPDGILFMGSADGVVDREAYGSFTLLSQALATRRWMKGVSMYSLMRKRQHVAAYPLDIITYSDFVRIGATPAATDVCSDGLSPIMVYIPATVNVNNLIFEIFVDWKVIYSTDNVLSNSHTLHPTLREDEMHALTTAAADLAGFVYEVGVAGVTPFEHAAVAISL